MTVQSGLKCLESSMRRGPLGSLERMLAASSAWNSTKCLLTWKWKATPQGRSILELSASTPRTAGCESGLLPVILKTPGAVETEGGVMEIRPGCDGHYKLRDQIAMLPTPQNRDFRTGGAHRWENPEKSRNLNDKLATLLPTPNAFDAKDENGWEMGSEWDRNKKEHTLPKAVGTSRGLKLHPDFVAWMMNYPLDWLDTSESPKHTSKSATKTGSKN